jgi:7-carboxy-7-deazaguanine synthase
VKSVAPARAAAELPTAKEGRPGGDRLKIHEIFYSIQGESTFAGRPCVFVRLTGCQMRCVWCDTEHAFYDGDWLPLDAIVERVRAFDCPLVEVTGGEPLLQPDVHPLMRRLCDLGFEVLLETGGGLDIAGVDRRVRRIVDVKCPASGESGNNRWENLDDLRATDELKFVVAGREDYDWAKRVIVERGLAGRCPIHLSPVWGAVDLESLAGWILADRLPVRLTHQLHKQIWGADAKGV